MPPLLQTIILLTLSNVFMTFAWYGHLGELRHKPLMLAVVISWGIAFFEYVLQVPANRIGANGGYSIAQLKILQEAIALAVFVPIAYFALKEPIRWDYLWAALCIVAAVFFIFRGRDGAPQAPPVTQVDATSGPGASGTAPPPAGPR